MKKRIYWPDLISIIGMVLFVVALPLSETNFPLAKWLSLVSLIFLVVSMFGAIDLGSKDENYNQAIPATIIFIGLIPVTLVTAILWL